jgi:hypothetical protein
LLSASRTEPDPAKLTEILEKAIGLLNQDSPAMWLWKANNIYGMNVNKIAFRPTPHNRVSGVEIIVTP